MLVSRRVWDHQRGVAFQDLGAHEDRSNLRETGSQTGQDGEPINIDVSPVEDPLRSKYPAQVANGVDGVSGSPQGHSCRTVLQSEKGRQVLHNDDSRGHRLRPLGKVTVPWGGPEPVELRNRRRQIAQPRRREAGIEDPQPHRVPRRGE